MIVVDASVAAKWFLLEDGRDKAMRVVASGEDLAAPDLVVLEVANVLRRKCRMGAVTDRQVRKACAVLAQCFSTLVAADQLIDDAVHLSIQLDHSVYDCAYLACARLLGARLLTADGRFLDKVRRSDVLSPHATSLDTF